MRLGLTKFRTINDAYSAVLQQILTSGSVCAPRGHTTRELLGVGFTVIDPRYRLLTLQERNWRFPIALGEFAWHLAGSDDIDFISYYITAWRKLADDPRRVLGSCYGWRLFSADGSAWLKLENLLKSDPDSRRAIVHFDPGQRNLDQGVRDASCASSIQFFNRDGCLDCHLVMRSNDAYLGLPYDFFVFSMLHELLAVRLGVQLGEFSLFSGSMHLYEGHLACATRIVEEHAVAPSNAKVGRMPAMVDPNGVANFLAAERTIRIGKENPTSVEHGSYWGDLIAVLADFANRSRGAAHVRPQTPIPSPYLEVL